MAYYGRRVTAGDVDMGGTLVNSGGNQRGQVFNAIGENGWATAIGQWGGKAPGSANVTWRGAIYYVNSDLSLGDLFRSSSAVTVSNVMDYGGAGQNQEAALSSPAMLWAGTRYGLAWAAVGGSYNHAMNQAANGPGGVANYYFHYRNVSGSPTNPFGASSTSYEGAMDAYVVYEPNEAPTVTTVGMAPAGMVTTSSPTFTGSFADANSDVGDKLKQYRIQVYTTGGATLMWDYTGSADAAMQAAAAFTQGYGGSALTPGQQYDWRYQVSDQFGVWSAWSSWVGFTVNGGGVVIDTAGTPTGKQETITPGPFTAVWDHVSGLSTNAVELRILQGTTVVRASATLAKTVADNGTISITWAESGLAGLSWGQSYTYQIRGRDTGNLWSPWSAGRAFTTNAMPSMPQLVSPKGGVAVSALPKLIALSTDADDTTATGFAVSARIKNSAGTVLFTRAMTYNATAQQWEYQTTSTDLASFAQYRWDAVATDGTLTSGYSAEAIFTYGQGPVVTVTAPTGSVATNTPTLQYSQNSTQTQAEYRIYAWDTATSSIIEPPLVTSGPASVPLSSGATGSYVVPSGVLHNGQSYKGYVKSTNNLGLVGEAYSPVFTVAFPLQPGPANLLASPLVVGNDAAPSAIMVSWDTPSYPSDKFNGALVLRRPQGSPLADATLLAYYTSVDQNIFIDYFPESGQPYTYAVYFLVVQGTDETESAIVEATASVTLEHVVITSVSDGTKRVGLRYGGPLRQEYTREETSVQPWGQEKPHTIRGKAKRRAYSGTFELQNDRYSLGANDLDDALELWEAGDTVCIRDWYGAIMFGDLFVGVQKGERGRVAQLTIRVTENDHVEGIPNG